MTNLPDMPKATAAFFSRLFIVAALWNLAGAIAGFFNTTFTYELIFSQPLTDPLMYAVYQGAWGTTLTYFIGYLIVARNPMRHFGIVVTGGLGKLGFIITMVKLYAAGIAGPVVFIIIVGDAVFLLLFVYYLTAVYSAGSNVYGTPAKPA